MDVDMDLCNLQGAPSLILRQSYKVENPYKLRNAVLKAHFASREKTMDKRPSPTALEAFGVSNLLTNVPGGRGLCFREANVLLRPSDDDEESEYIGSLCAILVKLNLVDYCVSTPIPVSESPEKYVADGWTAWTFVDGKMAPKSNFEILFKACRAFHTDLRTHVYEKPPFLSNRQNRFTEADLVTWGEKKLEDVQKVDDDILTAIQPSLEQLLRLRQPFQQELRNQLIHGDLTGNVLFHDSDRPPAIIDITLYWRPAEYAEAIIVADGLIWLDEGRELVEMYGTDHTRIQLLVRALYWRCLSFAIDSIVPWVNENLPKATFGHAIRIVGELYKPETQLITPPSESPSNETTRLTAEFISLMEIDDDRFGFQAYGPFWWEELPRRFGSVPALDTTTSAMIATFQSIRLRKRPDKTAFALYGKALRSLQECLVDDEQPVMLKLEVVLMMMLSYLLKEAVSQGEILHSGDIRAWCLQAIYAALCDPKIELGSWFWEVAVQDTIMTRPYHYEQNLYCFELGAIGDLPVFLRDPERYLYQLKCYYNMISQERPIMRKLYEQIMITTLSLNTTPASRMKAVEYASGHAGLLIQAALIGPTLKPFGVVTNYTEESHQVCDEAIHLAHQSWLRYLFSWLPNSSAASACLITIINATFIFMVDKSTNAPPASDVPSTMATEKQSSGFLKFIAFLDLFVKLAMAGALIGILVVMVQFNSKFEKFMNGDKSFPIRVSEGTPLRIVPGYASAFDVHMTNNANNPVWFKTNN
ncbi:hypothetical protein F53441_1199 [Fusarium austroafricanum]|uniref:Aminoglycoside phosphotransferase domain-containing protein n=1 Tax=Fusarium austroafricanum TaxID=2364996 RepID=A0A8H4KWT5_9HYPO|nr:hypothetical protein F53441_1199 [Fusarium austroafricanum]